MTEQIAAPNPVVTSGVQTADHTHISVDKNDPPCSYKGTACTTLRAVLPATAGSSNLHAEVVAIHYFMTNRGENLREIAGNTQLDWCKIFSATQHVEYLPNGQEQVVVTSILKNWSSAYQAYGRIDVEWHYVGPHEEKPREVNRRETAPPEHLGGGPPSSPLP